MTFIGLVRISAFGLLLLLSACRPCVDGSGEVKQDSRDIDAYRSVVLDCSADVFISQNRYPHTVTVKAQQEIIDNLEIEVRSGVLNIDSESCYRTSEPVEIYLNTDVVEGLEINGSGEIHSLTDLRGQELSIEIDGSGDVTAEVNYRLLTVGIRGSGDIRLGGQAERLEIDIKGSGDVKGPNMTCKSTSVHISGSGDAYVNAESYLEAHVSGSGDIKYTGFPTDTSFSVSGSGEIRSAYSR